MFLKMLGISSDAVFLSLSRSRSSLRTSEIRSDRSFSDRRIFGASGDLTQRKLVPALYQLKRERRLPAELTFAADIKTRFNLKNKPSNGVILAAAKPEQIALELSGNRPNAGLFTYDLTQYLWQVSPSPTMAIAFPHLRNLVASHSSEQQQPAILTNNHNNSVPPYHTTSEKSRVGAAIVTNLIDERTLEVNLVGLPLEILENYGINSCLSFIGAYVIIASAS